MPRPSPHLSRPVYEGLPWIYIISGIGALITSYLLAARGVLSLLVGMPGLVCVVGKHELIYVDERSGRQRGGFTDNLAALAAQPAETPAEEEDEAAEEADDQGLEATGPG